MLSVFGSRMPVVWTFKYLRSSVPQNITLMWIRMRGGLAKIQVCMEEADPDPRGKRLLKNPKNTL